VPKHLLTSLQHWFNQKYSALDGGIPIVEYSFDPDDYDRRDEYDFRRDERREQDRIDEMRRQDALDDFRRDAERDRAQEALREVMNNDEITLDKKLVTAINNPKMRMDRRGNIGLSTIRASGQFRNTGIPLKRTRKKTKTDRTMSKCLKIANKKFRKANGQLRKGKTMRDVMRHAHRLCRKEK